MHVVDVFVDELDLGALGFEDVDPAATGRAAIVCRGVFAWPGFTVLGLVEKLSD